MVKNFIYEPRKTRKTQKIIFKEKVERSSEQFLKYIEKWGLDFNRINLSILYIKISKSFIVYLTIFLIQ